MLPLRAAPERDWRYSGRWIIEDSNGLIEATGYVTKEEAEKDIPDLLRFLGDHLECPLGVSIGGREMNDTKNVIQVTKDEAVAMFTALGMKTAATWSKQRMSEKLVKLSEAYEVTHKIEGSTDEVQATFDKVYAAIKAGAGIELVRGEGVEGSAESEAAVGGGNDKPKREPKAKKEKVERAPGSYNPREGSGASKINAAIAAAEGQFDTKALSEASGISTARVGAHLASLTKRGIVKKVEAGKYVRADKVAEPVAAPAAGA